MSRHYKPVLSRSGSWSFVVRSRPAVYLPYEHAIGIRRGGSGTGVVGGASGVDQIPDGAGGGVVEVQRRCPLPDDGRFDGGRV